MRPWYRFVRFLAGTLARLLWGVRVEGAEHVPRAGPLLVTSNHLSNVDPALLGGVIPREVGFVAKEELFRVPVLGALIRSLNAMPLDRSRLSMAAIDRFGSHLGQGGALVYFPEGTRSRTGELGSAKVGVGVLLSRHPVPILPVRVNGTDSLFRNMFRRGRMRVVFGRPYTLPKGEGSGAAEREEYRRIAETVLEHIRGLDGSGASDQEAGNPAAPGEGSDGLSRGRAGDARIS
ncbi:MAG: lysophospholipid acyltransferase family protein [Candidatus Eiseniibacteriota bacterium]